MSRVAIITARGGSKRIPRKNIRDFYGKPVIAYVIEAALKSGVFDEVMVSTEDIEIAEVAKKYGAKVPFMRTSENSTDLAMTVPVLMEVLESYKKIGKNFDYFCCLYPVSPLIDPNNLVKAVELLKKPDIEVVLPVCRYSSAIQKSFKMEGDKLLFADPSLINTRSQDIEARFFDIGQFYFCKTDAFLKRGKLFTDFTSAIEVEELFAQDVDNEIDWKILEFKYAFLNQHKK
jgi:pseudaminic acid cytidylyltransferase